MIKTQRHSLSDFIAKENERGEQIKDDLLLSFREILQKMLVKPRGFYSDKEREEHALYIDSLKNIDDRF